MAWKEQPIIIYAMPGSQFTFKVLAALDARNLPHFVDFVPVQLEERRKVLPSGGTMVPEMKVGDGPEAAVVPDSESILHWLDDNLATKFFPSTKASELSARASTKTLACMVWYYNFVDEAGYTASMRKSFTKMLIPQWVPIFREALVDVLVSSERKRYRKRIMDTIGWDDNVLDDGPRMRSMLIEELTFFQSLLTKPSAEQPFLLAGTEPTAVDFSVYAQVERLVGGGASSDIDVPPAVKDVKDQGSGLKRLWEWHDLMRDNYPVKFKGKRVPRG